MKFIMGDITNSEGVTKNIVVKSALPVKGKDLLIGGGLIFAGVAWLTGTAFKWGALNFSDAEYKTLDSLGLVSDVPKVIKTNNRF